MAPSEAQLRGQFFKYLFGTEDGYVCIATQHPTDRTTFRQTFFAWPSQAPDMEDFIKKHSNNKNIWFGVNLLSAPERTKAYCRSHNLLWADLDECHPSKLDPPPQCIIESSPNRFQAIWRLDETIDPYLAENYSKKIAYKFRENGVDPSGWDLTQLLRVPFTHNFKYANAPTIQLLRAANVICPVEPFEAMAVEVPDSTDPYDEDMPLEESLVEPLNIVYKYQSYLRGTAFNALYDSEPPEDSDWSKLLWRLVNICLEAGMTKEEAFSVLLHAKCNKYNRDGRPIRFLWREIVKASSQQNRLQVFAGEEYKPLLMPEIISVGELASLKPTFIDTYREWASQATDAVVEYHNLSAFMLLSMLISGNVRIPTNSGTMVPNLWGLILGDSTLTRKTTAMNMAMEFVSEIDRELVFATDGSAEGILTGLQGRPNRVSVYYKDEVTGFFDSLINKPYLAGMQETMTQLYDVPPFYNRRLRKEVIELVSPVFIFFGGGIQEKLYSLVNDEFITSGFLPRFLILNGRADLSVLRRTGAPTVELMNARNEIKDQLSNIYEAYKIHTVTEILGQQVLMPVTVHAHLTDEAWSRYGDIETIMVQAAHESPMAMLALPTFNRLSRSLLKMAVLLASSRQLPTEVEHTITVEVRDILGAASYVQEWGKFTVDMLMNSGKTVMSRVIEKVVRTITQRPGLTRSDIARNHQFSKREMDDVIATLLDRGEIMVKQSGSGVRIWPI